MRQRCEKPTAVGFAHYGGRGISVCERWQTFENFLADMGTRSLGTSLDRIDNDGNYEPGNCRWATPSQQARNTSQNNIVAYDGATFTMIDLAERLGVRRHVLANRIKRGWPRERWAQQPDKRIQVRKHQAFQSKN
jgi:hypothetical protein